MGGVNVNAMAEFLQPQSCVNYETFCASYRLTGQ